MTTRIVCRDGLTYVGKIAKADTHRIYLLGHMHPIWIRSIQDMFEWDGRWRRVMGHVSTYDTYIAEGGTLWPAVFYEMLYTKDI